MLYGHVHDTYDEYLIDEFQRQTRASTRPVLGKSGEEEMVSIPCQMIKEAKRIGISFGD